MRGDSDVDVAIFETAHDALRGPHVLQRDMLLDLADALNLASPPYLDLHIFRNDDVGDDTLPWDLWASILREGVTVHTTGGYAERDRRKVAGLGGQQ